FDNQYGKLELSLSSQYNRIGEVSYEFIPVTKVLYRERVWRPFVFASYGSVGAIGAGAGVYYGNWGIGVQYLTDLKGNGFGVSVYRAF
ncbi:MAG: hypothetical protein LBL07_18175, partial [Tannerella sp.]|nr:hypothetical protein [Tannerella sp.]